MSELKGVRDHLAWPLHGPTRTLRPGDGKSGLPANPVLLSSGHPGMEEVRSEQRSGGGRPFPAQGLSPPLQGVIPPTAPHLLRGVSRRGRSSWPRCHLRAKVPIKPPLAARPVKSQERCSQTCQPNDLVELIDPFLPRPRPPARRGKAGLSSAPQSATAPHPDTGLGRGEGGGSSVGDPGLPPHLLPLPPRPSSPTLA